MRTLKALFDHHWVGRLARSNQSGAYTDYGEFRADIELAGVQMLKANRALGGKISDAIDLVLTDRLVCSALRDVLLSK